MTLFTSSERTAPVGASRERLESLMLHIARKAIAMRLAGGRYVPPPAQLVPMPHGVFVTLLGPGRELRGCSGQLGPLKNLAATVAECAVAAALDDTRFTPVQADDLPHLTIEVSLLEPPKSVLDLDELDPATYGVLVQQNGRSGVLLPGVDGVDRPEDQVAIACRKGFIDPMQRFDIARFRVRKVSE
jgi:AmmeMemoRadiSam system protein A